MQPIIPAAGKRAILSRRGFVLGAASGLAVSALPALAGSATGQVVSGLSTPTVLHGSQLSLSIGEQTVNFTGARRRAITVNQSLPAPILRWREGERVRVAVQNTLQQDTSLHWHGIILPSEMDGVPGLSFAGITPGQTFDYEFELRQNGTYWYHSHSHFQEQLGVYGAIIIDPDHKDPVAYDRDMVILLSDWSDIAPQKIVSTLKKESHYYNRDRRTLGDTWADVRREGLAGAWRERRMWNQMRMSDRDIADVTGYTYTYLMNGVTPGQGWTGVFQRGERLRLRFINGSAMTLFDVRIPGLKMTVVAADGQYVRAVEVDEFRMGAAETYDVIVEPAENRAFTIFAQSMDRSGYARGTLTPDASWQAEIPAMDPAPVLTHQDMGMGHNHGASGEQGHSAHGEGGSGGAQKAAASQDHSGHHTPIPESGSGAHQMHMNHEMTAGMKMPEDHAMHGDHTMSEVPVGHSMNDEHSMHGGHMMPEAQVMSADHSMHGAHAMAGDHSVHDGHAMTTAGGGHHDHMSHSEKPVGAALAPAGFGANFGDPTPVSHAASEFGPQVDMRADMPMSGIADPGVGLREHQERYGRRVLTYADLFALHPTRDKRQPTREIELHLTGNMHRYMWSVNGIRHADAAPIVLKYGERVRFVLVNDTMMTHPFHLHGLWSELETGDPDHIPRKHTVLVQPGSKVSYLVTADAKGRWAYHCHLLYHMGGMMREVQVI